MKKILFIDDDKQLCDLVRKSVLQENIDVDCCYLGAEGLKKLKDNKAAAWGCPSRISS